MNNPLVSIICLCYQQNRFLKETLDSAFAQTYDHIEVIVVDDGSTDGSKESIRNYLKSHPHVPFIDLTMNVGNTAAFNKGLEIASGKYIVDLACDDVLLNDRIERQVAFFEIQNKEVGVIYSDAAYINESGGFLEVHFQNGKWTPHTGDIYRQVVSEYFIPPPTMMMKKEVLSALNGYDESLAYEDFDFWVRSARKWHYAFQDETLSKIRKVEGSHASTLYGQGDKKLQSTIRICQKIMDLNRNELDNKALVVRLKYEFKHAFLTGHEKEAKQFYEMMEVLAPANWLYKGLLYINQLGVDWSYFRNLVIRLRS